MIEIPDVPTRTDCASCSSRLSWLWPPKVRDWICVVPVDDVSFRLHECRHAQNPATWRQLPHGSPPTPAYVRAREALAKGQERSEEER